MGVATLQTSYQEPRSIEVSEACTPNAQARVPLIVDLDGTLIRSDLLVESFFACLGRDPLQIIKLLSAWARGKAELKAQIAATTEIDASRLPYDDDILAMIKDARALGRQVHLASASNGRYVQSVADHLGLFDGWFASTDTENLSSTTKARRLVEAFGEGGFEYVGNDYKDLPVWAVACKRTAVRVAHRVKSKLLVMDPEAVILKTPGGQAQAWVRLLRLHQWTKNALVLVPLVTAERFDLVAASQIVAAFFAFSFGASSVYILNDLVDLGADRRHPTKRRRPLAAGVIPVSKALTAALILFATALLGALLINPWFATVLISYLAITTAYTFVLKRKMIVDVITLAALYTTRVIGGAAAISVPVSEWLLAFSMFIFTSLALIKRYIELTALLDRDLPDPSNRNYRASDLDIVAALAAATGFNAVTVFALYISSDTVRRLYHHPKMLWAVCPFLMYWLGRLLMMAHRRLMDDDPVIFTMKDRNSLVCFALIGAIVLGAMLL
jgi:4-hydroxybenzoate polyprenyltransferase/phosphoserine phosphatase